jgi:uncharacterized LabA/DUF88 family protein
VVLASGNGDFDILVQKIRQDKAKGVEVYGLSELTAGSLIKAADGLVIDSWAFVSGQLF